MPGGRKQADPRVFDKAFKERSIRKLIEYLVGHGYDRTISPQLLTSPSTKDFVHIVSFLLKKALPNFSFGPKFEDELPPLLKNLGYPGNTLSKGKLQTPGAEYAWPTILGALAWLVDLLRYTEAEAERLESGADVFGQEGEDGHKMFFDYLARGYELFLAGEDVRGPPTPRCSSAQPAGRTCARCASPAISPRGCVISRHLAQRACPHLPLHTRRTCRHSTRGSR